MTFREMAAEQGFSSSWWEAYGFVMNPLMFQRPRDAEYWKVYEVLDTKKLQSAHAIRKVVGLDGRRVSRALRLLVNDGVASKVGARYRFAA